MAEASFTIELAHVAGMAIGATMCASHSAQEARDIATHWLCPEHREALFATTRELVEATSNERDRRGQS